MKNENIEYKEIFKNSHFEHCLVRVNYEKIPETEEFGLIKGMLIMIIDPNNDNIIYADHLKYQGGGTYGEYHIISRFDSEKYKAWRANRENPPPQWEHIVNDLFGSDAMNDDVFNEIQKIRHLIAGNKAEWPEEYDEFDSPLCSRALLEIGSQWSDESYCSCDTETDPGCICPYIEENEYSTWYVAGDEELCFGSFLSVAEISKSVPGNMAFNY